MILKKFNPLFCSDFEMEIPISEEEFYICYEKFQNGEMIQNAFPMLNADQREFILTGTLPEQWDEMFQEDPEDFYEAEPDTDEDFKNAF